MNNDTTFSVLDAIDDLSEGGGIEDLFKPKTETNDTPEQPATTTANETPVVTPVAHEQPPAVKPKKEKTPWVPDNLDDLPEFSAKNKAVYSKEEIAEGSKPKELVNQLDDDATNNAQGAMSQMQRIESNIQTAKNTVGIKHCQIPEGHPMHVRIINAAEDTNIERAQMELIELFKQLIAQFPETIIAMNDGSVVPGQNTQYIATPENPNPEPIKDDPEFSGISIKDDTIKIVINKSQMKELQFTQDELEKIRTSRSIELNIVDEADLGFGMISDAPTVGNQLNTVLSKYVPEANSISCVLPASNYRCDVTGLSYAEVMDLEHSEKLQNLDGLRKKWAIAYKHIKNPSIGEFKAYKWYTDPATGNKRIVDIAETVPLEITPVTVVSAYDDFLKKTSYLDLDFILWKILCATAQDTEIVSVTCGVVVGKRKVVDEATGKPKMAPIYCNHHYETTYHPTTLLSVNDINADVLKEMDVTQNTKSMDSINEHFSKAPVSSRNAVKLPHSGFGVIYGHISAYDFVNKIYEISENLVDRDGEDSAIMPSEIVANIMLPTIKGFIIPDRDNPGTSTRYTDTTDILRILETLDEYDYNTIVMLNDRVVVPYQFSYRIEGAVCPKCKIKSDIQITELQELLFILAHSLTNTTVDLKKL